MSKIGNMSFDALKDYVARVATKTINSGQEFNTVHTGIIQQSLPGYYTVTLSNSNDTTVYNAIPLNTTDTFGPNDYVYLVKAPVSSGDNFNTKYYIFGLVSSTNEVYANLSDWERFLADEIKEGVIEPIVLSNKFGSNTNGEQTLTTIVSTGSSDGFFTNVNGKGVLAISLDVVCNQVAELPSSANYGIRIKCKDSSDGICQTTDGIKGIYDFGTEYFSGQPFHMDGVNQKKIIYLDDFTADIAKIEVCAYIKDIDPSKVTFSNMQLKAGSIQDLAGRFTVRIDVPKNGKDYFRSLTPDAAEQDVVSLQATPYYDSQPLAADSIQYYWFIKDDNITSDSDQYNSLAGEGWRCLNQFTREPIDGAGTTVKVWNNKNNVINIDEFGWKITNQMGKEFGTVAGWAQDSADNPLLKEYTSPKGTIKVLPTKDISKIKKGDYYKIDNGSTISGTAVNDILVALKNAPTTRKDWSVIKAKISIKPFDKFENTIKCIVKYMGAIARSAEYTVNNFAVHEFKAVLNSSNENNRLIQVDDKITLTCTISDYNEYAQNDSYVEKFSWIIKGKNKDTQEWIEITHDLASVSTALNALQIKDNDKDADNTAKAIETRNALEYELPQKVENVTFDLYSVQCYVQIAVDAADNAIELYSNEIKIESITYLAEDIKTIYIYKYFISKNMNVSFAKADGNNGWNGDWVIYDLDPTKPETIKMYTTWRELKKGSAWMEDNPVASNPRAAINFLSTDVTKDIWPLEQGATYGNGGAVAANDKPYLYYTRKAILYLYKGNTRTDYNSDIDGITPVEEYNWEEPVMLRQVWISSLGSSARVKEEKSAEEINQINTFNQLTKNGTEDGIFYQDEIYILTEDSAKQDGKTYYKKVGNEYQVYSGDWALNENYYEKSIDSNKLYINATYINTGTLRVGSKNNEKFYASIHNPEVKIGGYQVSGTDLMSEDEKVGISSSGDYAFWAGNAVKDSAPFRVTHSGDLYATNADITGHIHATSITIDGGFGGGNLLLNTGASSGTTNWIIYKGASSVEISEGGSASINNGEVTITGLNNGREVFYRFIKPELVDNLYELIPGQVYTLSGKIKVNSHTNFEKIIFRAEGSSRTTSPIGWDLADNDSNNSPFSDLKQDIYTKEDTINTWKKFSVSFKVPENAKSFYFSLQAYPNTYTGSFAFKELQLEEGWIATAWTLAKEELDSFASEFIVDNNQISMRASTLKLVGNKLEIDTTPLKLRNDSTLIINATNLQLTEAGALTITGTVTATAGSIGKVTICADGSIKNTNFEVTASGQLKATGADIGGVIRADSGSIGGWTLTESLLCKAKNGSYSGTGISATSCPTDPAFWAGYTGGGTDPWNDPPTEDWAANTAFYVCNNGSFTAKTGSIGPFSFNTDSFTATFSKDGSYHTCTLSKDGLSLGEYLNITPGTIYFNSEQTQYINNSGYSADTFSLSRIYDYDYIGRSRSGARLSANGYVGLLAQSSHNDYTVKSTVQSYLPYDQSYGCAEMKTSYGLLKTASISLLASSSESNIEIWSENLQINGSTGVSGTLTATDKKGDAQRCFSITVKNGIIIDVKGFDGKTSDKHYVWTSWTTS